MRSLFYLGFVRTYPSSLHRLATVDDQCMADDEASRIRTQPEDRGGNLVRPSHPSDWFLGDHFRAAFGRAASKAIHHWGGDVAGTDGVDADVLGRVVERGR